MIKLSMEKRELGVLGAVVLGIVIIGFFGNFTGYAVNQTSGKCNVADFNADGIVNYVDKGDFSEAYAGAPIKGDTDELLDFNSDGIISIQDANIYNRLYDENYGAVTGDCYLRGEEVEEVGEVEEVEEVAELPVQRVGFWQRVKDFFKKK